jgi:hypothetical protein
LGGEANARFVEASQIATHDEKQEAAMFNNTYPTSFFSIVTSAFVPQRHFEGAYHDPENRRGRKETLSVLAGLPYIDRGDFLPEISDREEKGL